MTDIDLIPGDYRERLRVQYWARQLAAAVTVVIVISVAGYFTFDYMNETISADISTLQAQQQISELQRGALTDLNKMKTHYLSQLSFLTGLRSGTAAPEMFSAIDQALHNKEVWFLNWDFRRAGAAVDKKENITSNGYFIVIPATDGEKTAENWKIETHMTIKGQAKDHAALSRFVRKLFSQAAIQDVRILNTSRISKASIVNFDLAVTVNSQSGNG